MSVRAVIDTNVVIAGHRTSSTKSPNAELLARWQTNGFLWLHSRDTLREYAAKLMELGVPQDEIKSFLARLILAGESVYIAVFHERNYPADPDDIAFILCAVNGAATHLVTYDSHLTTLAGRFEFRICSPRDFLSDLPA
jgi:uncharacterized protein